MYFIIPLILLLVFKVVLAHELWKGTRNHQVHDKTATKEAWEVTSVVVAIFVVFIISYTPITSFFVAAYFFGESFKQYHSCVALAAKSILLRFFPSLNSAVNFLIYFFSEKVFSYRIKGTCMQEGT